MNNASKDHNIHTIEYFILSLFFDMVKIIKQITIIDAINKPIRKLELIQPCLSYCKKTIDRITLSI